VSEDIQKMGCIEDSNTSRGFNQDISEVASAPGAPLGKKERVGFHLRRGEALANFIGERCEALANSKKVKLDPNAVEFIPGRTKSDAESAEKAAADKDATKAEDAQKKTDAKEVSDRETDKETAEFESEETVAKEEGGKESAQKSADEAAAKAESAGLYVKNSRAEILPQVEAKDFGVSHDENLSVPGETKGSYLRNEEARAQEIKVQSSVLEAKALESDAYGQELQISSLGKSGALEEEP